MCAGAIINARIPELFFGAADPKSGSCGSVINLFEEKFNHRPHITGGIMAGQCASLLTDFFQTLHKKD
jgi:tRNA(adenine34) deaminase